MLVVVLKPLKEDPLGKKNFQEHVYVTGSSGAYLNGKNACRGLLLGNPRPAGASEEDTPVFRKPETDCAYDEDDLHCWVAARFATAGLSSFGLATHCFCIGGVTTLTAVGGVAAAEWMRSWLGQEMALYVH